MSKIVPCDESDVLIITLADGRVLQLPARQVAAFELCLRYAQHEGLPIEIDATPGEGDHSAWVAWAYPASGEPSATPWAALLSLAAEIDLGEGR